MAKHLERDLENLQRDILMMGTAVEEMIAKAIRALRDRDVSLAREVIDELVRSMKRSPESIEHGLSLFSAVRHLERIADHATNIAEDVVYLVEGEIVRHRPEAARECE